MQKPPVHVPHIDHEPRCWRCNRRLAELLARPWSLRCPRCKAVNQSPPASPPIETKAPCQVT